MRRIQPFTFNSFTHNLVEAGNELSSTNGVRLYFTKQGFFRIDTTNGYEPWRGQRFDRNRWRIQSNVQATRWLRARFNTDGGSAVYYDPIDPYQGRSRNYSTGITFQPSGRFSQSVDYQHVAFDRASTGERVYTVNIVNTKTAYQFTPHFFLRGIVQYDSSRARVLTDFLSSYEPHPGTVVYAGYGSLIEERDFIDSQWVSGTGPYRTIAARAVPEDVVPIAFLATVDLIRRAVRVSRFTRRSRETEDEQRRLRFVAHASAAVGPRQRADTITRRGLQTNRRLDLSSGLSAALVV